MAKHRIRYSQDAMDDLDSIFDYISEDNRSAAAGLLKRLEESILQLADNPRIGAVLPTNELSLVEPGYRRIVVKPYLVFYRLGTDEVFIARVLHSRQDWMNLIFDGGYDKYEVD
ncbi:MAG: type II toxin-antitoxin system RelE/ParE family toxin [Bacillota bacterium]|nr:type II toxin-antitoxin system RelE/ParE family toxin [Bacillota bacterium]